MLMRKGNTINYLHKEDAALLVDGLVTMRALIP